jgi:hypothetical protein
MSYVGVEFDISFGLNVLASLLGGFILTKSEVVMDFLNAKQLACVGLVTFVFAEELGSIQKRCKFYLICSSGEKAHRRGNPPPST